MASLAIALLVFGLVMAGARCGLWLQTKLPEEHRDAQSKDTIQLVMSLVATMAALVLSLLIASTHTFYTTQQEEVQKLSRDVVLLDEALLRYGPETKGLRQILRDDIVSATRIMSPEEGFGSSTVAPAPRAVGHRLLFEGVQALDPKTPGQRYDQAKALDLMGSIASTRLLIHEQATSAVPAPLICIMVLWLTFLFLGFGLFARANETVNVAITLGAFSVATAIFLILDMSHPYRGLIHVSRVPIQGALEQIGR